MAVLNGAPSQACFRFLAEKTTCKCGFLLQKRPKTVEATGGAECGRRSGCQELRALAEIALVKVRSC